MTTESLVGGDDRPADRPDDQSADRPDDRQGELRRLQNEREALLRLGALAGTAPIGELFDAIAEELARVVDLRTGETYEDMSGLSRFNADATLTLLAAWGKVPGYPSPIGSTWPLEDGDSANGRVYRTGLPARLEGGIPVTGSISGRLGTIKANSSIAVPIFVDDALWGSATIVSDRDEPLPPSTEARLSDFAALASTAISSAQRREEVRRLVDEQSAIRRIATLVAQQPPLSEVYSRVCSELLMLLEAEDVRVVAYEPDGRITVVGAAGVIGDRIPIGFSAVVDPGFAVEQVRTSGAAARVDGYEGIAAAEAGSIVESGLRITLAQPIQLGDRLWGAVAVASASALKVTDRALPAMADSAELIATAIRNTEAAESIRASRERIVSAADESRQRFERNLHDGAQQRLVALALELRHNAKIAAQIDVGAVASELDAIVTDLRDLSHGLHPAVLSQAGLGGAIKMLARQCPTPVTLDLPEEWPIVSDRTQVASYYLLSEALTNVVKHSNASMVTVTVSVVDDALHITVVDDGVGGASLVSGSGLIGVSDRVEALGGSFEVVQGAVDGTRLEARLPLDTGREAPSGARIPGW